jgi:hypothetical protein
LEPTPAALVKQQPLEPPPEPAIAPVRIATSAPAPVESPRAAAPARVSNKVNSAPVASGSLQSREPKSQLDGPKPVSASKPERDTHDEARELLQAY